MFNVAFKIKKKPTNYKRNVLKIITCKNLEKKIKLCEKFVWNHVNFLRKNGIKFKEVQSLSNIKF